MRHARVVIVDDEPQIVEPLGDEIEALGFAVTRVTSAREALAALRAGGVDILVTDVRMPEVSGIELVSAWRAEGYRQPVIYVNGHSEFEPAGTDEAVIATLAKPVDFDALTAALLRAEAFAVR